MLSEAAGLTAVDHPHVKETMAPTHVLTQKEGPKPLVNRGSRLQINARKEPFGHFLFLDTGSDSRMRSASHVTGMPSSGYDRDEGTRSIGAC